MIQTNESRIDRVMRMLVGRRRTVRKRSRVPALAMLAVLLIIALATPAMAHMRDHWKGRGFLLFATLGYSTALRNAQLDAITTAIDAGGAAAHIKIYNGTQPATGGTATTVLADLTMSHPPASGASTGVLTMSAITQDSSADNTGTATWFRITTSAGTFVIDGTVGTSGADLNLVTTSIVATQPVQITSFVITNGDP